LDWPNDDTFREAKRLEMIALLQQLLGALRATQIGGCKFFSETAQHVINIIIISIGAGTALAVSRGSAALSLFIAGARAAAVAAATQLALWATQATASCECLRKDQTTEVTSCVIDMSTGNIIPGSILV